MGDDRNGNRTMRWVSMALCALVLSWARGGGLGLDSSIDVRPMKVAQR